MKNLSDHHLAYRDDQLYMEDMSLAAVAEQYGTPAYVYSAAAMRGQIAKLKTAFGSVLPADKQPLFCFACKANSNIHVLSLIAGEGCGIEIVSEGELVRALRAGVEPSKIVSTGVGKTAPEIRVALSAGIMQFNVESIPELERINAIADDMNMTARVAFRFNPNVAAGGDEKIMTGRTRDKFGIGPDRIFEACQMAQDLSHVEAVGLSMHIGSQIHEAQLFRQAYKRLADTVKDLREDGFKIRRLDVGGGFGICYEAEEPLDPVHIAEAVRDYILPLGVDVVMEPGRFLTGNAGVLLTRVEYAKETKDKRFLILDAAMNDLIRPSLYSAWHGFIPVKKGKSGEAHELVGPVCETGDTFARDREVPRMEEGELGVFLSAGAYGASMASNYNTRCLAPEILIDGGAARLIRRRQTYDDILALEEAV